MRKNPDEKVWGSEPQIEDFEALSTIEKIKALNWYNHFYDKETGVRWVSEWMDSRYPKKDIRKFIKAGSNISPTLAALARMNNKGTTVSPEKLNSLTGVLDEYIATVIEDEVTSETGKDSAISACIAEIDRLLDVFYLGNYKVANPPFTILPVLRIAKSKVKEVADYYRELRTFVTENSGTEDFANLSKRQLKAYMDVLNTICSELEAHAQPTPRKKPLINKKKPMRTKK